MVPLRILIWMTTSQSPMLTPPVPLKRLQGALEKLFRPYTPRAKERDASSSTHEIEVVSWDRELESRVESFMEVVRGESTISGWLRAEASPPELMRARLVELCCLGDSVDEVDDAAGRRHALNRFDPVPCKLCRAPDLSTVPDPFFVSPVVRRKPQQEVFRTSVGLIVVRSRVRHRLEGALGDWIEVGAAPVKGERQARRSAEDQLAWVRPTVAHAERLGQEICRRCPACTRPTEVRKNYSCRFTDDHVRISSLEQDLHLARSDLHFGMVDDGDPQYGFYVPLAISEALYGVLRSHHVKGLAADESAVFFEAGRGSPLETVARTLHADPPAPDLERKRRELLEVGGMRRTDTCTSISRPRTSW
jgi:hypothetical protein